MFLDFKVVGVFIQNEALRGFCFLHKIPAVGKRVLLIYADAHFAQLAKLLIIRIKLLVAVAVTVEFKDRARKLAVGKVLIHLHKLHFAADRRVFDFDLDHFTVFGNGYLVGGF